MFLPAGSNAENVGGYYGPKIWHSNDKYRRVVYQCNKKYQGSRCKTPHFTEEQLKQIVIEKINLVIKSRKEIIAAFVEMNDTIFDVSNLEKAKRRLETKISKISPELDKRIRKNSIVAQA